MANSTASKTTKDQIREAAEASLETFIELVHPQRVLGSIHRELIQWWEREDSSTHQLVLLPRDHGKSAMVGYRVAHAITKNPAIRILYISATSGLAVKQLKFIKDILTSDIYRKYWPEMVNLEESKREKWTETEISVDHPLRRKEAIRDSTVFTAGLTTTITGLHCDIAVLDDAVINDNAYTSEGRERVKTQYSFLSSIEGSDPQEWVVGTRYHPIDLYNDLLNMKVDTYTEEGDLNGHYELYEVFERKVESLGDGTGEFLWPLQLRYDGKPFGFNREILARKRAQYLDKTQFRAQYYNDPNDPTEAIITRDLFQYYNRALLSRERGKWHYKNRKLNVFASIDFAYSLSKGADFSSIVVIGVDYQNNYYVLDINRFKTDRIEKYFEELLALHQKWDFRKIKAEVTAAQAVIVKAIKERIKEHGLAISVVDHKPNRYEGSKEERTRAALEPRYENRQVWHYKGGNCQILEDELVVQRPAHDDVRDCLAVVIDFAQPPAGVSHNAVTAQQQALDKASYSRFGGVR